MKDVDRADRRVERSMDPLPRNQYVGWAMFGLSGVLFFINGVWLGDWLTAVASLLWIAGCVAFVVRPRP